MYDPIAQRRMAALMSQPAPQDKFMGQPAAPPPMEHPERRMLPQPRIPTAAETAPNSNNRYYDELQKVRGSMPMSSQYKTLLSAPPKMEDHQPSGLTRFGAALGGISAGYRDGAGEGVRVARDITEAPYRSAMEDYSTKVEAARRGAELESSDVDSQTKAIMDAQRLGLDYDEFLERREHNEGTRKINQQRADAYDRDVDKNEYQFTNVSGGIMAVNRNDPSDTMVIPGKTLAEVQAMTQQEFADIGRQNANTSSFNAQTSRQRLEHDKSYDNVRLNQMGADLQIRSQRYGQANTANQARARDMAMDDLMRDPDFRDLFDQNADPPIPRMDLEQEDYDDLMDEMGDRVDKILGKSTGGDELDDTPEFDANEYLETRRRSPFGRGF